MPVRPRPFLVFFSRWFPLPQLARWECICYLLIRHSPHNRVKLSDPPQGLRAAPSFPTSFPTFIDRGDLFANYGCGYMRLLKLDGALATGACRDLRSNDPNL
jgi:hypothetical protein